LFSILQFLTCQYLSLSYKLGYIKKVPKRPTSTQLQDQTRRSDGMKLRMLVKPEARFSCFPSHPQEVDNPTRLTQFFLAITIQFLSAHLCVTGHRGSSIAGQAVCMADIAGGVH
jgi:hypothetical protein